MKNISYWAYDNMIKARIIIVLVQTCLCLLCIYGGILLFAKDIILPEFLKHLGIALICFGTFFYPFRRAYYKIWKWSYVKQKTCDFALVFGYALTILTISNIDAEAAFYWQKNADYKVENIAFQQNTHISKDESVNTDMRTNLKHQYKKFILSQKNKAKEITKFEEFLLVTFGFLLIIASILLSCMVACNSGGPLGLLLLLGGMSLGVYMILLGTRGANPKKKNRYEKNTE